jgi:hypothetical protein
MVSRAEVAVADHCGTAAAMRSGSAWPTGLQAYVVHQLRRFVAAQSSSSSTQGCGYIYAKLAAAGHHGCCMHADAEAQAAEHWCSQHQWLQTADYLALLPASTPASATSAPVAAPSLSSQAPLLAWQQAQLAGWLGAAGGTLAVPTLRGSCCQVH